MPPVPNIHITRNPKTSNQSHVFCDNAFGITRIGRIMPTISTKYIAGLNFMSRIRMFILYPHKLPDTATFISLPLPEFVFQILLSTLIVTEMVPDRPVSGRNMPRRLTKSPPERVALLVVGRVTASATKLPEELMYSMRTVFSPTFPPISYLIECLPGAGSNTADPPDESSSEQNGKVNATKRIDNTFIPKLQSEPAPESNIAEL